MNQKKQRTLAIFALAMALVATTVAYAVLQTSLNVSGSVTRKGGSWNIYIDEPTNVKTTGGAELNLSRPSGTSLKFTATLKKPGDSFSFDFDLVNAGTIDANCSPWHFGGDMQTGEYFEIADYGTDMTCSLTYNGQLIDWWDSYVGDLLDLDASSASGTPTRKTLTMKCSYDNVSEISSEDKTLDIGLEFNYTQK